MFKKLKRFNSEFKIEKSKFKCGKLFKAKYI